MKKYAALLFLLFLVWSHPVSAEEVRLMDKDDLKTLLDNPDTIIFDVRITRDWNASGLKIKHAVHLPPESAGTELEKVDKGKTIVLYCA